MAEQSRGELFKLVWVSTVPRTGSMWTYNIARVILRESGYKVFPNPIPQSDMDMVAAAETGLKDVSPGNIWALKIHKLLRYDVPRSRIITTYRDPRDSLISFMRFMQCGFDRALDAAIRWTSYYDHLRGFPASIIMHVNYADIVGRPHDVARGICQHLEINLPPDVIGRIVADHSKKQVTKRVAAVETDVRRRSDVGEAVLPGEIVRLSDANQRVFDLSTGFQSGHVSDYKDGEWAKHLTIDQLRSMDKALSPWLARKAYSG